MIEAVEEGDRKQFMEEIGDLLFLVLSIVEAAESKGGRRRSAYAQIIEKTVQKYIVRHPHVFQSEKKMTPAEILAQWERQKAEKEKSHPLDRIPIALPALVQAKRVYEKASRLGISGVRRRANRTTRKKIGVALLRLVWHAVENGIDPEAALRFEIRNLRKAMKKVPVHLNPLPPGRERGAAE